MQILLNKQCGLWIIMHIGLAFIVHLTFLARLRLTDKADKLAEMEKSERQTQLQLEREEEMRELALRLRRRYVLDNINPMLQHID